MYPVREDKRDSSSSALPGILFGSDHAGFELKEILKSHLAGRYTIEDVGCTSKERCDYPDFGAKVGLELNGRLGIVICGSGIGISIAANKVKGIRCALCHDHLTARLAREHNDANVLAIGARIVGVDVAKDMVDVFLSTQVQERHQERIKKLNKI